MCDRENMSLQKGMNFRTPTGISIFLMSQRPSAPYDDALSEDGRKLFYEGHDASRSDGIRPKQIDQPWQTPGGRPTENAKFAQAARAGSDTRTLVRVYEKLLDGIWSDKGLFHLVGYTYSTKASEGRKIFRFELELTDIEVSEAAVIEEAEFGRIIPSWVKQTVFKRDGGKCVLCGAKEHLHFDHDFPYSRGGTSLLPENVRILCARHNLSKGARIE
jgi:hypothetical protein